MLFEEPEGVLDIPGNLATVLREGSAQQADNIGDATLSIAEVPQESCGMVEEDGLGLAGQAQEHFGVDALDMVIRLVAGDHRQNSLRHGADRGIAMADSRGESGFHSAGHYDVRPPAPCARFAATWTFQIRTAPRSTWPRTRPS